MRKTLLARDGHRRLLPTCSADARRDRGQANPSHTEHYHWTYSPTGRKQRRRRPTQRQPEREHHHVLFAVESR